ncbi:MAG: primosomal protein N', partial [Firmicutes bacterium]|nr:primosomal protein N' [Bacillota bacterium]
MEEGNYAGVVVDLDIPAADKVFHYRIPANLQKTVGVGDQVLVPFQHRSIAGYVVRLIKEPAVPRVKNIIRRISPRVLTGERIKLAAWIALRYNCYLIEALRLLLPPGGGKEVRSRGGKLVILDKPREAIEEALVHLRQRAPKQAAILNYLLQASNPVAPTEVIGAVGCSPAPLKALATKGIVSIREQAPLPLQSFNHDVFVSPPPTRLTPDQESAYGSICQSMEDKSPSRFLLHGVTGSGKTEVYLRAIAKNLEYGRGAIVLVPEISLTPQMVARFRARFGRKVAILHSRLSLGERYGEWWRIRRGEAPIVIGARSAIFAPVPALGLIILDEEHDSSYKQDVNPRYQTREVAEFRSQREGAVLILGSATPAVESYYRTRAGHYQLLFLGSRIGEGKMPEIELIDMRSEFEAGNRSFLSRSLQRDLERVLKNGEQVVLFLNRRGFASFILCRQCGYVALCPNCNVSLTLHEDSKSLRCHYCFHETAIPSLCPRCASV